jgi:hypothetical protein
MDVAEEALPQELATQCVIKASPDQPLQQARAMEWPHRSSKVPPPQGDTLWSSIMLPVPIGGHETSTIPLGEIAKWLTCCGGLTPGRVL